MSLNLIKEVALGHEERFPPPGLSGPCGFRKRSLLPMI